MYISSGLSHSSGAGARFAALFLLGIAAWVVSGPAEPASAQSAKDIFEDAIAAHAKRMEDVQNYTLIQETMGIETILYFERVEGAEGPEFELRKTIVGGAVLEDVATEDESPGGWDAYAFFPEIAERARYEGREDINGRSAHKIVVEDLGDLDFWGAMQTPEQGEYRPRRGTFFVDPDALVMVRMDMEGTITAPEGTRDANATIFMEDYREVDGMLHPFVTRMSFEGVMPADMSEEDIEEARRSMEELKKNMDAIPESMRGMLQQQLDNLERMVGSGTMEIQMTVKELRVNHGPPAVS
jgi:hypothetical protein